MILVNLARVLGVSLPQAEPDFTDSGEISSWALGAVGQVRKAGIMNGVDGGRFAPRDTYTREQSVVTIMQLCRFVTDSSSGG